MFVIPVLVAIYFFSLRFTKKKALIFANFEAIEKFAHKKILSKNLNILILRCVVVVFLVFGIVGVKYNYDARVSSFSYIIAIDSSGSMLALDIPPNRLEAAKDAAVAFVQSLPLNSRVGVVDFSGATFIRTPIIEDKEKVIKAIRQINISLVGGTAIGDAIITSTNLLSQEKQARSIVILTDGQNNVGATTPEAVDFAIFNNVVINTIGVGTKGGGVFKNYNESVTSIVNEEELKSIAGFTNGKYFLGDSPKALVDSFGSISESRQGKIAFDVSLYSFFVAIGILLLEFLLFNTRFRTIP